MKTDRSAIVSVNGFFAYIFECVKCSLTLKCVEFALKYVEFAMKYVEFKLHSMQLSMEHLKEIRHMVRKVIPEALPSHKKGEQPFLREELESGQNANELDRMKERVADKVIRMNPTQQIPIQAEHRQDHDQKKE